MAQIISLDEYRATKARQELAVGLDVESMALDMGLAAREDGPGRWWVVGPKSLALALVRAVFDLGLRPTMSQADMSGLEWLLILGEEKTAER